jgi:hypothetical protein
MAELFRQLAFITAILGGFAITFLSVLLTASATHRMVNWIVGVTTAAAVSFVLSALGATFSAVIATDAGADPLPSDVEALHEPLSLLFLGGTLLLFTALGMSGWLRSRSLGIATTVIATLGLIGGLFIIAPFIVTG